jgi:hypothetical protein
MLDGQQPLPFLQQRWSQSLQLQLQEQLFESMHYDPTSTNSESKEKKPVKLKKE